MPVNILPGILTSRFRYLFRCLLPAALAVLLLIFYQGSAAQSPPPTPAAAKLSPLPVTSPGSGPPLANSRPDSQDLDQRVAAALGAFGQANIQKLTIVSQSAADPEYNTPDKLLTYPGGAWEFEFYLDKTNQLFLYREALDTDELSIFKKGNSLWSKPSGQGWEELLSTLSTRQNRQTPQNEIKDTIPGKGWRKVKTSLLSRVPYNYSRATTLERYPFLYLWPYPRVIEKMGVSNLKGQDYYVIKVKPQAPKFTLKTGTGNISPDTPQELLLWVSSTGTPRIAKAVYFWVSYPPGGTLYTANQVSFEQN